MLTQKEREGANPSQRSYLKHFKLNSLHFIVTRHLLSDFTVDSSESGSIHILKSPKSDWKWCTCSRSNVDNQELPLNVNCLLWELSLDKQEIQLFLHKSIFKMCKNMRRIWNCWKLSKDGISQRWHLDKLGFTGWIFSCSPNKIHVYAL